MSKAASHDRELPFQGVFPYLLRSILFALGDIAAASSAGHQVKHADINRHFSWLCRAFVHGQNRHFFDGVGRLEPLRTNALRQDKISKADPTVLSLLNDRDSLDVDQHAPFIQQGATRISSLLMDNFAKANASARRSKDSELGSDGLTNGINLPSPLLVAIDFLTDPYLPETAEYAFYTARAFLFQVCQTCPIGYDAPTGYKQFTVADVKDEISKINTSLRDRNDSRGADPIKAAGRTGIGTVLRHLLALDGSFVLRFEKLSNLVRYCRNVETFQDIVPTTGAAFQFMRSLRLRKLPNEGLLINRLFGVPVPLRGAGTIFAGGLRLNSEHGLVIAVHGDAGAGKTSLALALATSLAPLGFQTLFLTAEETQSDLESKIQSLRAADIERISCVKGTASNVKFINLSEQAELEDDNSTIIKRVIAILSENMVLVDHEREASPPSELVSPTKSVIILDGIHDMLATEALIADGEASSRINYDLLRALIETCRKQRSLVILTTGTEWANSQGIDYLVDMSMEVSNEPISDFSTRPRRQLVITKARHQLCSVGGHGFHIGGNRGFRFTPQANYLLEGLAGLEPHLADQSLRKLIFSRQYVLSGGEPRGDASSSLPTKNGFEIYHRSNIFINGRGSGGKAALAMRIAMTPFVNRNEVRGARIQRCRILIVSFLYGSDYYQNIYERLKTAIIREHAHIPRGYHSAPDVVQLYPGYITSDELLFKIKSILDAEALRGEPYTDIIFDGIHNVFLQFPELEDNVVFWPQMFSLMRHYDASMITTNTILVVDDPESHAGELSVDNRKSEPLRQALVYKTDFYLELNKTRGTPRRDYDEFAVRVRSAIAQRVPAEPVVWNREAMVFVNSDQGQLGV